MYTPILCNYIAAIGCSTWNSRSRQIAQTSDRQQDKLVQWTGCSRVWHGAEDCSTSRVVYDEARPLQRISLQTVLPSDIVWNVKKYAASRRPTVFRLKLLLQLGSFNSSLTNARRRIYLVYFWYVLTAEWNYVIFWDAGNISILSVVLKLLQKKIATSMIHENNDWAW